METIKSEHYEKIISAEFEKIISAIKSEKIKLKEFGEKIDLSSLHLNFLRLRSYLIADYLTDTVRTALKSTEKLSINIIDEQHLVIYQIG